MAWLVYFKLVRQIMLYIQLLTCVSLVFFTYIGLYTLNWLDKLCCTYNY